MAEHGTLDLPAVDATGDAGGDEQGEILWIGTATVLIRCLGFTILTDPNFLHQGQHAPLGYGLRSRRLTEPARTIAELPPLDFVILSHHHGDHFDEIAARDLDKDLPIITTPHAARKLGRQGFNRPIALDTWESQTVRRGTAQARITSVPAKHAPQPLEALLPPVMGSVVDFSLGGEDRFRLYITGDTLLHDRLAEIPHRYPDIDLGLIHLGGTKVLGVLVTMDAAQGVKALRLIQPRAAIPIHHGDYTVFKSPIEDFQAEVAKADLTTEVHELERGETYTFDLGSARP